MGAKAARVGIRSSWLDAPKELKNAQQAEDFEKDMAPSQE